MTHVGDKTRNLDASGKMLRWFLLAAIGVCLVLLAWFLLAERAA